MDPRDLGWFWGVENIQESSVDGLVLGALYVG